MKKKVFFPICCYFLITANGWSQTGTVNQPLLNETTQIKELKSRNNIATDVSSILNITGIGGTVFSASNIADGTDKSYMHNLRIVLNLNIENKTEKYQLVFYSQDDKIPFAVSDEINVFSVYYPIIMYQNIIEKFEQSFANKKKVQLKVIQKANGYREGSLIF